MIHTVVFRDQEDRVRGFHISGHAGYGQAGEDVAIERLTEDRFSMTADDKKGDMLYSVEGIPSREASLLLEALVLGLEGMADDENYAEYIDLTFQEV